MEIKLESKELIVSISEYGAELKSIFNKITQKELLWQADPQIWGRTSPILFPIVGRLKNDEYIHNNITYSLKQHGFARDQVFNYSIINNNQIEFSLKSNLETLKIYPFIFEIKINYTLNDSELLIKYEILNKDNQPIIFSFGTHPGFCIDDTFENSKLYFDHIENERHLLTNGLFNSEIEALEINNNCLILKQEYFDKDAIVFKGTLNSQIIWEKQDGQKFMRLKHKGFTDLGIWTQKGQNKFLCLEPWAGFSDSEKGNYNNELINKAGIRSLAMGKSYKAEIEIEFY